MSWSPGKVLFSVVGPSLLPAAFRGLCVRVCVCVCVSLLSFLLPSCVTMGKLLNVSVPVSSFVVRVSSDNTCALLNGAPGR